MSIKLNDKELKLLFGLRHELIVFYLSLRKRMDFATGLVGARQGCGVCWQGLREDLHVEPLQGIRASTPSKETVRRIGNALAKLGLIRIISKGKRLVFFCVLADADNSVQIKADRTPTYLTDIKGDTSQANNGAALRGKADIEGDMTKTAIPDTHPVSGKDKQNTHTGARARNELSAIDYDFKICDSINVYVRLNLMPDPPDVDLCRLEFIEHFSGLIDDKTDKLFVTNEAGKTKLFRKWLIRKKMFYQRDEKNREAVSNGRIQEGDKRPTAREAIAAANPAASEPKNRSVIEINDFESSSS